MRRLLAVCSAVALLCGAPGCLWYRHNYLASRCIIDDDPPYGSRDGSGGCGPCAAPAPAPPPEVIKNVPRDVLPPGDAK